MLLDAGIVLMERGLLPDSLLKWGIRSVCKERLTDESVAKSESGYLASRLAELNQSPVAALPQEANEQHYELPPQFFEQVLGKRLKYSSCYYPAGHESLDEAEEAMLSLYAERAELENGMDILELGCGWGSLTLWLAEHYPDSRITAVSNSSPQRLYIEKKAELKGLHNINVITSDMNYFDTDRKFDRVISVEMFEHMRNYSQLLKNISGWLKDGGKLFVHIFCHREYCYPYEKEGTSNWMAQYFFSGGYMPSENLFSHFKEDMKIEKQWRVNGQHYQKTSMHWLQNLDAKKAAIMPVLEAQYGTVQSGLWFNRWRVFFLSCAELFGYAGGEEWIVGHYLMSRR